MEISYYVECDAISSRTSSANEIPEACRKAVVNQTEPTLNDQNEPADNSTENNPADESLENDLD